MRDLENKTHLWGNWNTLLRHKGQHLVVIHDSVKGLNPLWIDITIQNDPLLLVLWLVWVVVFVHVSHDDREYTISPLFGLGVHATIELIGSDGFRIDDIVDGWDLSSIIGLGKSLPDSGFSATGVTNNEARVTYHKNFSKLDDLLDETIFGLETASLGDLSCDSIKLEIDLWLGNDTWEEIENETEEDLSIIDDNLWHVEISETSHEDQIFVYIWLSSLETTSLSEYRLYGTETPIIMDLLGKKVLGKVIEAHELLGKISGSGETFRHEHVFADKNDIWDNHCATSEESLKVLWKLSTSSITWVHGNEETYGNFKTNLLIEEEESVLGWVELDLAYGIKDVLDLS